MLFLLVFSVIQLMLARLALRLVRLYLLRNILPSLNLTISAKDSGLFFNSLLDIAYNLWTVFHEECSIYTLSNINS
jgi:hypothetical protein